MKRILIETLFTVLITELTLVIILMILFSTLTTVIKNLNDGIRFRVVGSTDYGTGGITNEESRQIQRRNH